MKRWKMPTPLSWVLAGLMASYPLGAQAQELVKTSRATELRSDKLAAAPVLGAVPAGAGLRLLSLEGGWAWVDWGTQRGWVRAGTLQLPSELADVSRLASGRLAAGNQAIGLTVRGLPAKSTRHALIISISRYADPKTSPLPGARVDKESATQIAQAMQVPQANIRYLQDEQATGDHIRQALADLNARVQEGDRVFIHYSGHGTRFPDPESGGCAEALSTYDGGVWKGMVLHREMAQLLQPVARKADKLFVMYDACHSGGLVSKLPLPRNRGHAPDGDEPPLQGRFTPTSEACAKPSNVKTRSWLDEASAMGVYPQDIVFLSAARPDEVSLEDPQKGGLATQYLRDCLLRDAVDLDGSGAISVEELQQCAQKKINLRMKNDSLFTPHHLMLSGNRHFVPAWFSQAWPVSQVQGAASTGVVNAVAQTPTPQPPATPLPSSPSVPTATPANPPTVPSPGSLPAAVLTLPPVPPQQAPLTGAQALRQLFDQRDGKRRVQLQLGKSTLRIGQDPLDLSIQSDRAGYVYVASAGSDNQSLVLLFPNDLDGNNRIEAGQQLLLPRPSWPIKAAGPAGKNSLLVVVTDGPRDLSTLGKAPGSPFARSLNDAQGRAQLGLLLGNSVSSSQAACPVGSSRPLPATCSDAYGAAWATVEERP
ncbi:caspase family protein [Curvibacter sp. HBC28]|uniref:Caspase family protein n=1 Tax=Curvibacter microcysteis TaxID=3026419 RepID=A0ABT5MGW0_9BURK|nr:caspase family protein [Curvibacter sp. HBC28]MDD0815817.1 caspase family protein [Curvibacter sp. HBC28]